MTMRKAWITLLALVGVTCNQAIITAPDGSTIQVFANPEFIAANGDTAVITAVLVEGTGQPVVDGTVVQFFTTLGRIDAQGKTNDGVARVNLVSDVNSGTANITAISGTLSESTTVDIGVGRPARIFMSANPTRIEVDTPQRRSRIVATVVDETGNPIRNVPVLFSLSSTGGSTSTETLASGGQPVFTDSNGQAVDFLQTSYPKNAPQKTVTVEATATNGVTSEPGVSVLIN